MSIRVEFYGIPRQRAGVAAATVEVTSAATALRDVFRELCVRFPDLARGCFRQDGSLNHGCAANLNGDCFVTDTATPVPDGTCLLILSADAGG